MAIKLLDGPEWHVSRLRCVVSCNIAGDHADMGRRNICTRMLQRMPAADSSASS